MTGYTVRRYDQLETFPEMIEQELRPAVCERRLTDRQTDRLTENYSIDYKFVDLNTPDPGTCSSCTLYRQCVSYNIVVLLVLDLKFLSNCT